MGILDIFKPKAVDENKFNSPQFQNELLAFAFWKYNENNGDLLMVQNELLKQKDIKLNKEQCEFIIEKLKKTIELSNETFQAGQV
jgi:hypothetical protein